MSFEFATAERVMVGPGRLREVPDAVSLWGPRVLVVTGRSAARVRPLIESLEQGGLEPRLLSVQGEPTVDLVLKGCQIAREQRSESVVALGGGSAIDAGKAIAALVTNPGEVVDYLEVVGSGQPLTKPGLPFAAIPTTAGTGAEVTRNAVLASAEHGVKVSLRSPLLLARLAVIDAELTYGLPPRLTAATGMDALTQLIEPFVSCRANALTDAVCREGLARVGRSIRTAYATALRLDPEEGAGLEPGERAAREDMAIAAWFSGMALANAGLGAVHGFAGPIGGMFPAPHGEVCAALLPQVMARNLAVLSEQSPQHPALERFREIGRLLCGVSEATAQDGLDWVRALVSDLRIPRLAEHGISQADIPGLVAKAQRASSMRGNPVSLSVEDLTQVLRETL